MCVLRLAHLYVLVWLFRFVPPLLFLLFRCFNTLIASFAPLTSPLFPPLMLPARHNHHCEHDVFFYLADTSQNTPPRIILLSFCLVSVPPVVMHPTAPICIDNCPSVTILNHFLSKMEKHHVRGNFPGHMAQNHALCTSICPCLPCFPARPHPHTL